MIVLGVSPGLGALAYSVLRLNGAPLVEPLDSDVLHAGRGVTPREAWQIARRIAAHQLILDVILERHPPAIVAIGPPADPKEPPEAIAAVRLAIKGFGALLNVPVYDFAEREQLATALACTPRELSAGVQRRLSSVLASRDRRIVLATAAGLAAMIAVRERVA